MALKEQYLSQFPEDSLFEVYGSTELGVNCILEPADQRRKPGSCGRPAPFVELVLFDDDGNVVEGVGPEHAGELFVRSSATFTTYYKAQEKYEADRRGDWHTVGDIAYRDDEGFIYICDRKKDMIISGGVNIYPGRDRGRPRTASQRVRCGRLRRPERSVGRGCPRRDRGQADWVNHGRRRDRFRP